ncbi:(Fe-S)-binding protein [Nocardiopsis coralliicola]
MLARMGVRATAPAAQSCCGQPALNSGHPRPAAALARHWVRTFERYPAVVSVSGSCTATAVHHYPRLLTGGWRSRAAAVLERTWEFTRFVADYGAALPARAQPGPGGEPATACYHDSCHMLRTLGERAAPRTVLDRIGGLELREMEDPDICCGFGGTFAVKFPEVSTAMADRKLDQAARTGAGDLVSADAGCLLHLQARAARRGGTGQRHLHVAEVLAAALDGGPGGAGEGR